MIHTGPGVSSRPYLNEHPAELAEVEVVGEEAQDSTAVFGEDTTTDRRHQETALHHRERERHRAIWRETERERERERERDRDKNKNRERQR